MSERIIMPKDGDAKIIGNKKTGKSRLKFLPTGRNLYVQLDPVSEHITEGGVIIPDKHGETTRLAMVIATGPKVEDDRLVYGCIVLIEFIAGTAIHIPRINFLDDTRRIIAESEIITVVEEEEILEEK